MALRFNLLQTFPSSSRLFSANSTPRGCRFPLLCQKQKELKSGINGKSTGCRIKNDYGCVRSNGNLNRRKLHATGAEEVEPFTTKNSMKNIMASLKAFYVFSRPYACIGTIIGVASASLMAIENLSDVSLPFLFGLMKAIAAFSCLIVYTNGVNQLFDIEIDKVNKPYLPLVSGEMSLQMGVAIVCASALMGLIIPYVIGSVPLLWGAFAYLFIFSAYSIELPLLRWKKSAIGAAFSISVGYAVVLQLATYLHMQTFVLGRQAKLSRTLGFGVLIMSTFYAVVALFKDIPDIEGDRKHGINSLATRLGKEKVFWVCVYLLEMAYACAVVFGATSAHPWSKLIIMLSHVSLASILWTKAKATDLEKNDEITAFYMLIWKLVYAEHCLIPLVK